MNTEYSHALWLILHIALDLGIHLKSSGRDYSKSKLHMLALVSLSCSPSEYTPDT